MEIEMEESSSLLPSSFQEEDDSYMAYSDDSASLSDAYFQPTDADMFPVSAVLPNYGATKIDAIREDEEERLPFNPVTHQQRPSRKQMRQMRHNEMKRREQAARERAVKLVRGQPQPLTAWQDTFWAVIFIIQLLIVILCALRFGFHVILFNKDSGWRHYVQPPSGNYHWESGRNTQEHNATIKAIITNTDDSVPSEHYYIDSAQPNSKIISGDDSFTIDYKNVIALVTITGFYACIMSYLSFGFMLILSRSLIQIMLIFAILVSLSWGLLGLTMDPYGIISIMGFSALLLTLGYTMYNWNKIPFAATNLYTALCAMRCTADVTILGLVALMVAFGWCVIWTMAFVGIVNSFNHVDCDIKEKCQAHVAHQHIPLYLLLLLSFHWTNSVIKNIVRVTVASAIGTWWFQPSAISPCCTPAVMNPLWRSVTKSLGSICLGSLLIQPAQTLSIFFRCVVCDSQIESPCLEDRTVHETGVVKDELTQVDSAVETIGLCRRTANMLQSWLRFIRCCNRWSFTYIGMYNYSFAEAGEKAIQLFETREWLDVVKDNLIQNVLFMASVVIGGSAGIFAVVVEETDGYDFTSFHKPIISAFLIGSVLGFILSNILLLGVVGSAVNTVLVCFAAGPFEFDKNHPSLSREMRDVWSQQVWEPV